MKIGIPVVEKDMNSMMDSRFGRCPYFVIVDSETGEGKVIENPGATASSGAGVRAVETLINAGVEAIITSEVGPNAAAMLEESGIKVLRSPSGLKVKDALQKYQNGELQTIHGATHRGKERHDQEHG